MLGEKGVKRKWVGRVLSVANKLNICIVLVEKTKESKPTGKSRCRFEDTIKKILKEICLENVKYPFGTE
jgi:hypothetical protein